MSYQVEQTPQQKTLNLRCGKDNTLTFKDLQGSCILKGREKQVSGGSTHSQHLVDVCVILACETLVAL